MEDITDADCVHAKRVFKDFELNNLGEHHDLYLKCDTLLFADVFKNFGKMCLLIYQLDPAELLSLISLASSFSKDRCKNYETDIDMLLMIQKGILGGICQSFNRYVKATNICMKN